MHKNKFYKRHDGVGMGYPLGTTITNFFLAHMENKFFNSNLDFLPKFYLRNVDDIFQFFMMIPVGVAKSEGQGAGPFPIELLPMIKMWKKFIVFTVSVSFIIFLRTEHAYNTNY